MLLREWNRRDAAMRDAGDALAAFIAGASAAEIAASHGQPGAAADGVLGLCELVESGSRLCDGAACRFADGARALEHRLAGVDPRPLGRVRCLGHCYAAPAFESGRRVYARPAGLTGGAWVDSWGEGVQPAQDLGPIPRRALTPAPVVLRHLLPGGRATAATPWVLPPDAGNQALPNDDAILAALDISDSSGLGESARALAARWRLARSASGGPPVVVADGGGSDPGTFIDRLLLEEDPHAVLAGIDACARATGATRAVVYVRAEYPRGHDVMQRAVGAARAAGRLGGLELAILSGPGNHVCSEVTALLDAIEGRAGAPRLGASEGTPRLFGRPALVHDLETLAVAAWRVRTGRAPGTRVLCVSGAVRLPGAIEVAGATTLRRVLMEGAGGVPDASGSGVSDTRVSGASNSRAWKMALAGGPLGRVLPASAFDAPVEAITGLGRGGVVVLDASVTARALAEHLFRFARGESCGTCESCRDGADRLAAAHNPGDLEHRLATMEAGSRCGFGARAARPIRDLLAHFGDELFVATH